MITTLLTVLLIVYSIYIAMLLKYSLHMLQQNRYEVRRFRSWQKKSVTKLYPLRVILHWLVASILFLILKPIEIWLLFVILMLGIDVISSAIQFKGLRYIKNLIYTSRVKRQIFTITFIYIFLVVLVTITMKNTGYYFILAIALALFSIYQMHIVSLACLINAPLEKYYKNKYMKQAQVKLNSYNNLKKIGITGSYGKTSCKNIISEVLSQSFYCLPTPASFNTPLGISISINNDLQAIHDVFICEMGADKVGEITELHNFVKPNVGLVTSIGPQHLETFKNIDNIIHEKMQMVELMEADDIVVLNKDEKHIREYTITSKCKVIWYGIKEDAQYRATNIKFDKDGTTFDINIEGVTYQFKTKLLGEHSVYNILAAIAIGMHFGVPIIQLQIAVRQLKFIKNRLELVKKDKYTVIDNAFNSNPVSSKMSLDVLSRMPGKKICITPGLIELGEKQDYYNREFGKYFLDKCDVVILVGRKQTKAIYEGLNESGFNMKNVFVVTTIYNAHAILHNHIEDNCYVLYENDLPDAFNV